MIEPRARAAMVFAIASVLAGCAARTDEGASAAAELETQALTCGARGPEAERLYADAVAQARAHLAGQRQCLGPSAFAGANTIWNVADQAARAVAICPQFRELIRASASAEPIRSVLASSLTLKALTGELLALHQGAWQRDLTHVDAYFPGTTMTGTRVRVTFGPDGAAVYSAQQCDGTWRDEAATYEVRRAGDEAGPRQVRVVHGGRTETWELDVRPALGGDPSSAPEFILVATTASLGSIEAECADVQGLGKTCMPL